jgi:hypothetical protein
MKRMVLTLLLAFGAASAQAALYMPTGPQTNVGLSTVIAGGWIQCYAATFNVSVGMQGHNVLNQCNGDYPMMAGRLTGSSTFLVLAAANRADTIFETGKTSTITHLANGSNWWYSSDWSWGFTAANDGVNNNRCDVSNSPTSMCLHTNGNGGYRINNISSLNSSICTRRSSSSPTRPRPRQCRSRLAWHCWGLACSVSPSRANANPERSLSGHDPRHGGDRPLTPRRAR